MSQTEAFEFMAGTYEPYTWYKKGGFHPVHLYDELDGRYTVLRKLGLGDNATVWLALDSHSNTYVALKIFSSDASEREALEQLSTYLQLQDLKAFEDSGAPLLGIRRHFKFSGPNGWHICFVMDLKGPPFCGTYDNHNFVEMIGERRVRQPGNLLSHHIPKAAAKQAAKEVLAGLNVWHSNGFTHGNLCSDQVLANLPPINPHRVRPGNLINDEFEIDPLVRLDGKEHPEAPLYLVQPSLQDCLPVQRRLSTKIKPLVSMIGLSGPARLRDYPHVPTLESAFWSPELIITNYFCKEVDIWSFGCLLFQIFTNSMLIETYVYHHNDDYETLKDRHLLQIIEVMGKPLPRNLRRLWPGANRYLDSDGYICTDPQFDNEVASLEEALDGRLPADMDDTDKKEFLELLRWILDLDPTTRPTISEVMQHPWFNDEEASKS